jgi:adenylate cyclase class 2
LNLLVGFSIRFQRGCFKLHSEVEVKFKVDDPVHAERLLESHGFRRVGECLEVDHYYNHPCRDFRETDEALRIRLRTCGSTKALALTYKGPRETGVQYIKVRREIELQVDPSEFEKLKSLFESLGFKLVLSFAKRRVLYEGTGVKATLDELLGVGYFLELELVSGDMRGVFKSLVGEFIEKHGFEPIDKTYLEICLEINTCRLME